MADELANALAGIPEDPWVKGQPFVTTANALAYRDPYAAEVAELQQQLRDAQGREGQDALARLLMTAIAPMAALHRASGNLPKAISRHIAQERKEGNPFFGPLGLVGVGAYGGGIPMAINELAATGNPWPAIMMGTGALTTGALSKNHFTSTARILEHLNRTEPKTKTVY